MDLMQCRSFIRWGAYGACLRYTPDKAARPNPSHSANAFAVLPLKGARLRKACSRSQSLYERTLQVKHTIYSQPIAESDPILTQKLSTLNAWIEKAEELHMYVNHSPNTPVNKSGNGTESGMTGWLVLHCSLFATAHTLCTQERASVSTGAIETANNATASRHRRFSKQDGDISEAAS